MSNKRIGDFGSCSDDMCPDCGRDIFSCVCNGEGEEDLGDFEDEIDLDEFENDSDIFGEDELEDAEYDEFSDNY